MILLLVKAGADVNSEQYDGTTPLMDAAEELSLSNAKLLISLGANITKQNTAGESAFTLAQQQIRQIQGGGNQSPEYATELSDLLRF